MLGLPGFLYKPLIHGLGWTREKTELFLVDVRKAIKDRHVHAYHRVHVVYGRRPSAEEERRMLLVPGQGRHNMV